MKCSKCGADTSHELSAHHLCAHCRNKEFVKKGMAEDRRMTLLLGLALLLIGFSVYFTILLVQALHKYIAS
jgi:DNA-directed RNA polymerase subunit RPC12/RpoP